jgi:hypothetical protein
MNFDFKNMETYHYFIYGGAAVAVIAVLLYFVAGGKLRLPAVFAAGLSCLVLGVGAGVVLLGALGYNWNEKPKSEASADGQPAGDPSKGSGKGPAKGPGGFGKGPGGFGGGPGGGGPGLVAPSSKAQLTSLVRQLNTLSEKPLTVTLNDDQKKKIAEQIKDLGAMESLSEDEAKKRVEALEEVVKADRPSLSAVGYRWSGEMPKGGGGGFGGKGKDAPANPFKEGSAKESLETLLKRVEK